jgi:preprotein translocase subunit SecG
LIYLFYTLHVISCLFLILVVLFQQGKGADLAVFGGGATQAAFGARGAATLLHKLTVGFFIAFVITTMGIGILESSQPTVMRGVETETATTPPPPDAATPAPAPPATANPADAPGPTQLEATSEQTTGEQAPPEATP